jgi:hypothetical protein
VDDLQAVTSAINNSVSRVIGMAPARVNENNEISVFLKRYYSKIPKKTPFCFKVGDLVRTRNQRAVFSKGYTPNYSAERYEVVHRLATQPHRYSLQDREDGRLLNRNFYSVELTLAGEEGGVKKVPVRARKL